MSQHVTLAQLGQRERDMLAKVEEREAAVLKRELAVHEAEMQVAKLREELDLKVSQLQSFDAMSSFQKTEMQRREVELDG